MSVISYMVSLIILTFLLLSFSFLSIPTNVYTDPEKTIYRVFLHKILHVQLDIVIQY